MNKKYWNWLMPLCCIVAAFIIGPCIMSVSEAALELRQSTPVNLKIGPFSDPTDGITPETGLTIRVATIRLSKNGGNIIPKNDANDCTHDELGIYECLLDTTDTNTLGILQLWQIDEANACPVWHNYMVLDPNIWDTKYSTGEVDVYSVKGATPLTVQGIADGIDAGSADMNTIVTAVAKIDSSSELRTLLAGSDTAVAIASAQITAEEVWEDPNAASLSGLAEAVWEDANALAITDFNDPNVAQIADGVWDEVLTGATHNAATSAGRKLRQAQSVLIIHEGTATAGGNNTITLQNTASGTNTWYYNCWIIIIDGTGAGQLRHVMSYVGSTFVATMDSDWITNPDATSEYIVMARSTTMLHQISASGLAQVTEAVPTAEEMWEDANAVTQGPTAEEVWEDANAVTQGPTAEEIWEDPNTLNAELVWEDPNAVTQGPTAEEVWEDPNAIAVADFDDPNVAEIADAVLDELVTDHTTEYSLAWFINILRNALGIIR